MIKLTYFALLGVFVLTLLGVLAYFLMKPTPSGDSSVGWALGLMYIAGLAAILLLALLFWKNKAIGICILCIPLAFAVLPSLKGAVRDLYAWIPTGKVAPLTLHIANNTQALVNVKLECWFGEGDEQSLYKTLEFTSKPLAVDRHLLSDQDAQLIHMKAALVRISLYECLQDSGNGFSYVREVQPCMQVQDIPPKDFRNGNYLIAIDGEKNSEAFKAEVSRLKSDSLYRNGAF